MNKFLDTANYLFLYFLILTVTWISIHIYVAVKDDWGIFAYAVPVIGFNIYRHGLNWLEQ